jgi:hypothetical protein
MRSGTERAGTKELARRAMLKKLKSALPSPLLQYELGPQLIHLAFF